MFLLLNDVFLCLLWLAHLLYVFISYFMAIVRYCDFHLSKLSLCLPFSFCGQERNMDIVFFLYHEIELLVYSVHCLKMFASMVPDHAVTLQVIVVWLLGNTLVSISEGFHAGPGIVM